MFAVYLSIGVVGLVLLLLTFIIGELIDGIMDSVGPDYLSGTTVAGFLSTLGFVGLWVYDATSNSGLASGVGFVAGLGMGALAGWASTKLMKGGDEDTVRTAGLVGLTGNVVADIPADGMGQVSVVAAGHITRLNARAEKPLSAGSAVVVTSVLSPTSVIVEETT